MAVEAKIGFRPLGPSAVAPSPTAVPPAWGAAASTPHSVDSAPGPTLHGAVPSAKAGLDQAVMSANAETAAHPLIKR
jgi:hypothetical protein